MESLFLDREELNHVKDGETIKIKTNDTLGYYYTTFAYPPFQSGSIECKELKPTHYMYEKPEEYRNYEGGSTEHTSLYQFPCPGTYTFIVTGETQYNSRSDRAEPLPARTFTVLVETNGQ